MAEVQNEEAPAQPAPVEKKSSKKLLIIIAAAVLLLAAAGAGAYFFFSQEPEASAEEDEPAGKNGKSKAEKGSKKEKPKGPAQYVTLDPPFVTNFEANGRVRFLQVTIDIMTRDPATVELIKQHDPMIRNDLLLLLSNQQYEIISTRAGKEQLRTEARQIVAKIIGAEGGNGKNIEQLYFTSFVMQ